MKPIVDLEECLSDSPTFRSILKEHEENVDHLDTSVEKLIKLSNNMVEAGKNYSKSQVAFIRGLDELKSNFSKNDAMRNVMERIKSTLTDFVQHQNTLNDQVQRAVGSNLSNFMKTEVARVKETKKHFDKISDELDNNLIRASQVPRSKTSTEFKEVDNLLTATRSCFQHTSLDYVNQISCLQSKKRYEILESVISLLQAFGTFFHQGLDSYTDIEPMLKATGKTLPKMRDETQEIEKQVEKSYTKVTEVVRQPLLIKTKNEVRLEGYLFKRTTNAFKSWNRRWFMIKSHQLVYKKRDCDGENSLTVMEEDLRLCLVRTSYEVDRRFCFEVVSPTKSHILQADSEETCKTWISALAAGIDAAHSDSRSHHSDSRSHHSDSRPHARILSSKSSDSLSSSSSSNKSPSNKTSLSGSCEVRNSIRPTSDLLSLSNNFKCCDCGSSDPKWASINLGITLCIECSGIHRSLGVHVSKVRSLTLDDWEPTWIQILTRLGNSNVNIVFEAEIPEDAATRPVHDSSREVREKWIREKYISKSFVNRCSEDADEFLYKMTLEKNMVGMIQALSSGGNINWKNGSVKGSTALHEAAKGDSTEVTEFLLLNGANVNLQDDDGMTPFQRAIEAGQKGQIALMIKRGADLAITDSSGRDCVSIALEKSDADIVTLLRLAKLNEEMKNDDLGNPTEELLNDMVRDLSCNKLTST